jgi:hypothetical protein
MDLIVTVKNVLAVALTVAAGAAPPASAQNWKADGRWYVARIGAEPCVPLADVGFNFERLYYSSGQMRTPADYEAHLRVVFGPVTTQPGLPEGVIGYNVNIPGRGSTVMLLFLNEDRCQVMMSVMPK